MRNIIKFLLKKLGYNLHKSNYTIGNNFKKISFSQCGEDLIIDYIFSLRGIYNPTYIDIGANHPHYINNTALFHLKGCKGINVEANPMLLGNIIKYRPNDINLNFGISNKEEELTFYIMEDNTLSTFSNQEFDFMLSSGKKLKEKIKVKLKTLDFILSEFNDNIFPDFLSIDVEGFDDKILKSINFEHSSPKVICVEAAEYSPVGAGKRKSELIDFLISKNYYEYANTNLNAIMVRKDFWFING